MHRVDHIKVAAMQKAREVADFIQGKSQAVCDEAKARMTVSHDIGTGLLLVLI
jgi:hypothetical protein